MLTAVPDETTADDTAPTLLDLFERLASELQGELVERDREIHGAQVALLSAQHCFLLGPPGTAKSALIDRLVARISDVQLYKILMRRMTMPDEIFGPIDVPALQVSRWTRASAGYLPSAQICFLDEVFKSSSAILNGLLDILNERQWRDDGQIKPVPLSTMFCASNEEPQDDGLTALYDRIMLRYVVRPVQDTSNFVTMLGMGTPGPATPVLTWAQIETAKAEVAALAIGPAVFEKIAELRTKLKEAGIEPTERRFVKSLGILRAEAWLDGAAAVAPSHMSIMAHALWERPEQAADVETIVLELANPQERKALKLLADIESINTLLDAALKSQLSEDDAHSRGMEIFAKVKSAFKELNVIESESGGGRRLAEIVGRSRTRLFGICKPLIVDIFQMPESSMSTFLGGADTEGKK